MMRGVIVRSLLAVTVGAAGCRPANVQPPATPLALPPDVGPDTQPSPTGASASSEAARAGAAARGSMSGREDGEALFVKPLGFLSTPRIAGDRDGVVFAASGGCGERGSPAAAREPGSFVVLTKLDNEGNKVWNKTFVAPCGPAADGVPHAIAGVGLDRSGNIYLAGELMSEIGPIDFGGGTLASAGGSDVFVVSFDATGRHRWSRHFGDGATQRGVAMAVSPEGLVVVAGSLEGSADFGGGLVKSAGKSDAFVAVLDSAGRHVASHAFGDAGDQHADLVAFGRKGEVMLAGRYEGVIDFGGGPLPAGKPQGTFVAQYRDNGPGSSPRYAFAFSKALPVDVVIGGLAGGSDGTYLAGQFRGVLDLGGPPIKAHEPEDKNAGRADAFVAKLDAQGKSVFTRAFGLGGTHRIEALALAHDLWIAGEFSGMTRFGDTLMSAGDNDALLVQLDAERGEVKHAWRFGDTFAQRIVGLAAGGPAGSLFLLAGNHGTIDFGTGPQPEHGGFLVRVAATPPLAKSGSEADSPSAKAADAGAGR